MQPHTGHHAHTLRLDEDLPFLAFTRADRCASIVVGPAEPFAIPAGVFNGSFHGLPLIGVFLLWFWCAISPGDFLHFTASQHKQASDKHTLGSFAIFVGGRLEGLPRGIREAI